MRLGLGLGLGNRIATGRGGAAVDPHADAYFYDDFARGPEALNGSTPVKGNDWSATGTAADLMEVNTGVMRQTGVVANNSGYGYSNVPGATLKRIRVKFKYTDTPDFGPCIALIASGIPMGDGSDIAIHGEMGLTTLYLRFLPGFLDPQWVLREADFTLVADTVYILELVSTGEWAMMTLSDADGTVICREVAWEPAMATYLGDYFFVQTLSDKIAYTETELLISDPSIPTITLDKQVNTDFAADADGFRDTLGFGGSQSWESGALTITGTSVFQGSERLLGVGAVEVGDVIYVSLGVTEAISGQGEIGLIPYGTQGPTLAQDGGGNVLPGIASGTGRRQFTLTVTQASESAALIICNTGADGEFSIKLDSVVVIKNPPTSIT